MHTKLKTRLMIIWLILAMSLLCAIAITYIYADNNNGQTITADITYAPPENNLSKLTFKGYDKYGDELNYNVVYYTVRLRANVAGEIVIPKTYTNALGWTAPVIKILTPYSDSTGSRANSSVTKIIIPDTVETIEEGAFGSFTALTSVTLGNGITKIKEGTFSSCTSLTSITIPNSVTTIDEKAFNGCTSLTDVFIPDNVRMINEYAFQGCTSLTSVTIGAGIWTIRPYTFSGCTSLTNVTIGSNVYRIFHQAFENCTSLTKITIPKSMSRIDRFAFVDSSLEEAIFENVEGWGRWDGSNAVSVSSSEMSDPSCVAVYLMSYHRLEQGGHTDDDY